MFSQFKNKKVLVMGLGLHGGGAGVAKFFNYCGAIVTVTDLKGEKQLRPSLKKLAKLPIAYTLGTHKEEDFKNADLVIKNPAVSYDNKFLKIAKKAGAQIETDISVFLNLCPAEIVGITGSKGKSTTASLIYHLLKGNYPKTFFAGNIGISPLEILSNADENSLVVLELSSFELENLRKSPHIAVITSILPDHLDRYKSMEKYIASKKFIYKKQNKGDILVLNADDKMAKVFAKEAKGKVYLAKNSQGKGIDCFIKDGHIYFENEVVCRVDDLNIYGEHNLSNAVLAVCVAKICGVSSDKIGKKVNGFKGVPHRQEFVQEIGGVKYFNDTTATMPDAAASAVKTFLVRFPKAKLIFISGGVDKGLKYNKMTSELNKTVSAVVLLPGTASEKIKKQLKVKVIEACSIDEAVKFASDIAKSGDVVVLSPGAASFNLFKNEFDRGNKFVKAVNRLKK